MAKKRAFIRYTKKGKLVPGSLITTQGSYPSGPATWKEVTYDLCCDGGNTVCFTSSVASYDSPFWSIYGKWSDEIIYGSPYQVYTFTQGALALATSIGEWVQIANVFYSWMGVSFSVNSTDPSQVDICMTESLFKGMFPAEDGSTVNFYIGAA